MLHIAEVIIYSMDKGEESWAIEGEVVFEDDINAPFEASYLFEEEEWESLSLELDIDETYSLSATKKAILEAAQQFDE